MKNFLSQISTPSTLPRRLAFAGLALALAGIGVLHFVTPGYHVFHHDTYRRLTYFPIVLGAILFGWKGGLALAGLASIAFIPHLLIYVGNDPRMYLNELVEIALYLAAGGVTGAIATRETRLREKYRVLAEKLEESRQRLHRETTLLLEAEAQLGASQKLFALGRLSASLAHEIKNPLGSIRGIAEIFLDEFSEGHPKREFAEILLKEVGRMDTTVSNVLRYARGVGGGEPERREPLAETLRQVVRLLATHLAKKKVRCELGDLMAAEDFLVNGGRLAQVFLNLVLNAIDAVPAQGGRVTVIARSEADGVAVWVADNGPGVPESERERIFQPFVSGKDGGTGLGLSISRKIVESYGGRLVCCEEEFSGGACFAVVLPRAASEPSLAGGAPRPAEGRGAGAVSDPR